MIGFVRVIETPDGKTWVDLEDYQKLQKMYEAAVGFESNEQIIARKGEDEIPEPDPLEVYKEWLKKEIETTDTEIKNNSIGYSKRVRFGYINALRKAQRKLERLGL